MKEATQRQVKLPLAEKGKVTGEAKLKEKESHNKTWVVVIFIVTVLASLAFSLSNRRPRVSEFYEEERGGSGAVTPVTEKEKEPGSGWFGPAKYEFGE